MRDESLVACREGRNTTNREVPEIGTFKPSRCDFRLTEHPEPLISARIEAQKAFRSNRFGGCGEISVAMHATTVAVN
jgi:hypothetical protein